jgi:hypothetical protein
VSTEQLAVAQPKKKPITFGSKGVELATFEDAFRFSNCVALSGFAPKGMEKPEAILVAVQLGLEIGLTPMAALQNIGVINGRPGIYGDAALALVRASGLLESYQQSYRGDGEKLTAVVTVKRKGDPVEIISEFGVADAKAANLWGKAGPWSAYPRRMLLFRARGFALRDAFGDVLKGLRTTEELADIPPEKNVTPIREAKVPVASGDVPFDFGQPEAALPTAEQQSAEPQGQAASPAGADKESAAPAPASDALSPAEKLVQLAANAGVDFEAVESWAKTRKLNASKDSDAQKIINAWPTVSSVLMAPQGGAK